MEFRAEVTGDRGEETRIMGLSSSEDRNPSLSRFDTIPDCDGRSDGQTDRQTYGFTIASTTLSIASYADAL